MNCRECHNQLSGYVDRQLPAEMQSQVENHLNDCGHCQTLVQAEIRTRNLFCEIYRPEKAPFALRALVRQRLAPRTKRATLLQLISTRPVFAVLTIIAVFAVISLAYQIYHSHHLTSLFRVGYRVGLPGTLECFDYLNQNSEPVEKNITPSQPDLGLLTAPHTFYSFVPNEMDQMLQAHPEYRHRQVTITGWLFYQANYIEIEKFDLIPQTASATGQSAVFPVADSVFVTNIKGLIVCINEELAKIRHSQPVCDQAGHLYGLKTADGSIWSFLLNPLGKELQRDDSLRLRSVQVKGRIFYAAKMIDVSDLAILPATSE